jgi:nifR3 family TIM-barrel protein
MLKQLKIGDLTLCHNLLLAPMAGITNLPFRLIAREMGASLCFTEMVSSDGLVREGRKSFELLNSSSEDRPLGIQIFGDDPDLLAESARLVEGYGELIDINMGCPVRKVVSSGAGSALMRDPARVGSIVERVRKTVRLPITVKMRIGWNGEEENYLEIARIAEDAGCDAITLHPRSRSQMFTGSADWSKIRELKQRVKIPVIGSGDLFSGADVAEMMNKTGCDGVMIARGALGNPWIFSEALQILDGKEPVPPTSGERLEIAMQHLELFISFAGERVAIREIRKHLAWYARGIPGAARFRAMVNTTEEKEKLTQLLLDFFTTVPAHHVQ